MIIKNALVYGENFTFSKKDIYIENEYISENTTTDCRLIQAKDCLVIPGLIDIHLHGCMGFDFSDGSNEALTAMADYESKNGITAFVPAIMTLPEGTLMRLCKTAGQYHNRTGSILAGINLEGPFLSQSAKGAQNIRYLRKPDIALFHRLNKASGHLIKLVSIAPETEGAMDFIRELKNETILSIGHTSSDYNTAMEALKNGASHVTHLYNAMPPFSHRAPGVIGAAFDTKNCHVELICDGIHINPTVIRATFKLFGDDRIILISDSMTATGMNNGDYFLGGQPVTVRGNKATMTDGTIAGSVTNLMDCVRLAVSFGIPLESVIKTVTYNPAKELRLDRQMGTISPGKYANLVILDKNLNTLAVFIKGKQV
jgi:N-acetylglucosamine-6-phosphate deacetylase